jgi:hypothetical protein
MYQMMKLFLRMILLSLLIGTFSLQAQLSYGLKGGVGLSQITGYWRGGTSTYRVIPSSSAALGVYGQMGVGQRWLLRSELLFSHVTDHYFMRFPFTDAWGNLTDQFATTEIWRNATYLSLPVLFGVRIHQLDIFLGMQGSLALRSNGKERLLFPGNGEPVEFINRYPSPIFRLFDVGPKAAIQWHFAERFALEGSYYHGLLAIQQARNYPWPFRVRQLLVGAQWQLTKKQALP